MIIILKEVICMHDEIGINVFEMMTMSDLLNIVSNYPKLAISNNIKLRDIESLEEGNYIIDKFPPIDLLKQFPYFLNCTGEIQLLQINDLWIMNISKNSHSYYSGELIPILKDGTNIIFNIHSHPNKDESINVGVPSINDLKYGNSLNKLVYIIHDKGVLEYDMSSIESIDKDELDILWVKFFFSNPSFKNMNIYELENIFCDKIGLKRRNLSFEEFYLLCNETNIGKKR